MSQAFPLTEQLKALENLQEIDLKVDSLKKAKSDLPTVIKTLDEGVGKLRASIEAKKKSQEDIEKNQRQTQAAMELNRDRQTRAVGKLEGVQNSHEFQAASKEIEQLKKLSGTLEDQAKKAGVDIAALATEITRLTTEMDELNGKREEQAAQVSAQENKLDSDIGSLTAERTQFTTKVEARLMAQYQRVRAARAGLGIVPAVGGRCKGCNMMVPPQLFIEIQRASQLHQCPSCHRILYVASQPAP